MVNWSRYVEGFDSKHELIEYCGNNCYIPTKGYLFIKCISYLTRLDQKQQNLDFLKAKSEQLTLWRRQEFNKFVRQIFLTLVVLTVLGKKLELLQREIKLYTYTTIIFV